jgi:hypothetical protein
MIQKVHSQPAIGKFQEEGEPLIKKKPDACAIPFKGACLTGVLLRNVSRRHSLGHKSSPERAPYISTGCRSAAPEPCVNGAQNPRSPEGAQDDSKHYFLVCSPSRFETHTSTIGKDVTSLDVYHIHDKYSPRCQGKPARILTPCRQSAFPSAPSAALSGLPGFIPHHYAGLDASHLHPALVSFALSGLCGPHGIGNKNLMHSTSQR